MRTFRALTVEEAGSGIKRSLVMKNISTIPNKHILIKVKYSCFNYMDYLVLTGDKSVQANYPLTAGIDASGIVEESTSDYFKKGDEVIVTGHKLGLSTDGGFGQYICVPENAPISLPTGLTLQDAMTIGTEGLTAALAAMELLSAEISDKTKNILITGASIGIGAFAVGIMSLCGYKVTAVTSKPENEDFIKSLGAKKVVLYEKFIAEQDEFNPSEQYNCAIETFGGQALKTAVMAMKSGGSIAVCNSMMSKVATIPIDTITSKGINIIGIDSINCSNKVRLAAWYNLAGEWYLKTLPWLCNEVSIMDIEACIEKFNKRDVRGRIVLNHEL